MSKKSLWSAMTAMPKTAEELRFRTLLRLGAMGVVALAIIVLIAAPWLLIILAVIGAVVFVARLYRQ